MIGEEADMLKKNNEYQYQDINQSLREYVGQAQKGSRLTKQSILAGTSSERGQPTTQCKKRVSSERKRMKTIDTDGQLSRAQILQHIAGKIRQVKMTQITKKRKKECNIKERIEELQKKIQNEMNKKKKKGKKSRQEEKFISELIEDIKGLSNQTQGKLHSTPLNENSSWFSNTFEAFVKKERSDSILLTPIREKQEPRKKQDDQVGKSQRLKAESDKGSKSKAKVTFTYTSPSPKPKTFRSWSQIPLTPLVEKKPVLPPKLSRVSCPTCGRDCLCKKKNQPCKKCKKKCACPSDHPY